MRGHDREKNLAREVYYSDTYFSYSQLWSFVEQIYHIRSFFPESVLEVGVGNGFVSTFFRSMEIHVKTFDINPNLKPDVVASVHQIGDYVKPGEFDLISCCEVLEHMPFEDFEQTIRTFSSISNNLFLTLPLNGWNVGFGGIIQIPRFWRWFGLWLRLPVARRRLPDMHFWEVDYERRTHRNEILKRLQTYYQKVEVGTFKLNPYHCYFKCSTATTSYDR